MRRSVSDETEAPLNYGFTTPPQGDDPFTTVSVPPPFVIALPLRLNVRAVNAKPAILIEPATTDVV